MEQAKTVDRERYPDADVVVVGQQAWTRYADDGTYVEWFEQYVKVLTEKGRRSYRTLTSSFTIPYNTTRFTVVEIVSEDGTVRTIDIEKNSREMVDSSQMASNIYDPNDRLLQVSVPGLDRGDMVHFITYDEFSKARMAGEFSDLSTFEGTDPIVFALDTIIAPRSKPLRSIALKNEIPGTVTFRNFEDDDLIVYQWTARDVPRAFAEPQMPPLYTQAQRLLVSTIPDWQTVSRWYWRLARPHLEKTTAEMRSTVERLIKGRKTRQAKIEAVFFWVSQEVRYLGITAETEAPGYEPHPVSMTYERRAGVCRDKAALLVAMLRLAGVEAYPVLIMNGPRKDPEVPQPFFNHAIAAVRNRDGSYQLMDPTDENTKELFPSYLNNQSFLVATPWGETLMTSPVDPAEKNMVRISTTGELDARGTLHATTTLVYEGINDNAYRGHFSMLSDAERRNYFEKTLRKIVPAASLARLTIEPGTMLDTARELRATIEFYVENYPVPGNGATLIPVFRFGDTIGLTNSLVNKMGLKKRRYTYMTETTCGVEETLSIRLDPFYGEYLDVPFMEAAVDEGSAWTRSVDVSGGSLKSRNVFLMKLTEYSPDQYDRLQDTLARIEKANRYIPAFSPSLAVGSDKAWYAGFSPDAVVLDDMTDVRIIDATTVQETVSRRIKVLTYAGKKNYGEIRIPYNPVWEEVRLEKAVVLPPGGEMIKIDPREINVMDQEWTGRAPRYPAGKILVASLPGVREGCIIEYCYVMKRRDDPSFLITGTFQGEDPIEHKTLRIRVPDGIDLNIRKADCGFHGTHAWAPFARGFISERRTKDGLDTVVEFSAGPVPPLKPEDGMPPGYSFKPTVFASRMTMRELSGKVRDALESASQKGALSTRKARDITAGLSREDQRIVAVRDYVAKNVKSVGITISKLPLNRISTADTTFSDGYGNAADTAVLLGAMLRAIGYDPQFVLVSSAPSVGAMGQAFVEFPSLQWFGPVLVKITTAKGTIYLGDTDQYSALGSVASHGIPGLNLTTGAVETIRVSDQMFMDRTDCYASIDLNEQGDALVAYRRTYYGMDASRFLKDYSEMTPEERRRRHEEIVSSISRSARPEGAWKVSGGQYPVVEEIEMRVPSYAVREGDLMTLEIPVLLRGLSYVSGGERTNPFFRDSVRRQRIEVELTLPGGCIHMVRQPPEHRVFEAAGMGKITMDTKIDPPSGSGGQPARTVLRIVQEVENRPGFLLPEEYGELLSVHRSLSHPGMRTVVLKMEPLP